MDDFREDFLKCLHLNVKGELRALQVKKGEEWALGTGAGPCYLVPGPGVIKAGEQWPI